MYKAVLLYRVLSNQIVAENKFTEVCPDGGLRFCDVNVFLYCHLYYKGNTRFTIVTIEKKCFRFLLEHMVSG